MIWRRDRVPTLTVAADVRDAATPEGAVQSLEPAIEKLEASYRAVTTSRSAARSMRARNRRLRVFALLPAALFLMLLFLMAQLHSLGRVALVVATVPLGLIGIVLALLLANRPLEFVANPRIFALVGMIARNAVILIDQIETERAQVARHLGRGGRGDALPLPSDHADGGVDRAGPDSIAPTVFWDRWRLRSSAACSSPPC